MFELHELSSRGAPASEAADDQGAVLVEVLVAMLLAAVMATGTVALSSVAARVTHTARARTSALALAEQRLEQLRALIWSGGIDDVPRQTDLVTDLSVQPPSASGPGLAPAPADALQVNRDGYVDFLDAAGRWVGSGTRQPAAAMFIRRWSIAPASHAPNDAVVLQVLVTTVVPGGDEVRLATLKTRKVR